MFSPQRPTRILLPRVRRNVHRFPTQHQVPQTSDEALPQRGRPDGRRNDHVGVRWPNSAHVHRAVQLQLGRISGRSEVVPLAVDADLAVATVPPQRQLVPHAIVDAASRGPHLDRARAQVHVDVDVAVQQLNREEVGLQSK